MGVTAKVTVKASTVRGNTLAVTVVVPPSSLIESLDSDSVSFGASSFSTMVTVLAAPKSPPPRAPATVSCSFVVPSKKSSSTAVISVVISETPVPTPAGSVSSVASIL